MVFLSLSLSLTDITFSDITVNVILRKRGKLMRDHVKGGALTETTFFVLLALYRPNHGYGIMQFIEQETKGRLSLGPGTLYGAINALLGKGWIAPFGEEQDSRKKLYLITEEGRRVAEKELKRLIELCGIARKIIKGSGDGE